MRKNGNGETEESNAVFRIDPKGNRQCENSDVFRCISERRILAK